MQLRELLKSVKKYYPEFLQYDWDNSGLNIGDLESEVSKVLTTLEVTKSTIEEAIDNNVDLIISHHPFLFSKINAITTDEDKGKLIYKLIHNNISVYCMHTSYDVAIDGLNDVFLDKIGIENIGILDEIGSSPDYRNGEVYGLGRVGKLNEPVKVVDFIGYLKEKLNLKSARFIGNSETIVEKIAVVTGSGAEYFSEIKNTDIDLLITGDMKYHQAVDATELGVCVVDLGHFGTEYIFADSMKVFLEEKIPGIEVIKSNKLMNPFIEL